MSKKALIIRHAAWGDLVMASVVPPYLKEDGYEVHFMTNKRGMEVLANNPNIDRLIYYCDDSVPLKELDDYYGFLSLEYDKTVILTGSIEGTFLFSYPDYRYFWCIGKRRKVCKGNYYDYQIELAGYKPNGIRTGQLYFNSNELIFGKNMRHNFKDKFLILWALTGSATHKIYLDAEHVATEFLNKHKDAVIMTAGSWQEYTLGFDHERSINLASRDVSLKHTFMLAKVADLVIGPETGLLNAAGCFDTPKICLLSHSSKENLTSTWTNDFSLQAISSCSPCHLLHKYAIIWRNVCQSDKQTGMPQCAGEGHPRQRILDEMEKVYQLTKERSICRNN